MKLNVFSGGLNLRIAPHLIHPHQSVICENAKIESGKLENFKDGKDTSIELSSPYFIQYYTQDNQKFLETSNKVSGFMYLDKLYYTVENEIPKFYDGTNYYPLGLKEPQDTPQVAISGSGYLNGDYEYVYTYYDSTTGLESPPSKVSNTITANNESIQITIPYTAPSGLADYKGDKIRLYRLGGLLTNFTLVAELNITGNNITYVDNTPDIDKQIGYSTDFLGNYEKFMKPHIVKFKFFGTLVKIALPPAEGKIFIDPIEKFVKRIGEIAGAAGNHILDSYNYYQAPEGLKYLTMAYAIAFGAVEDKLYFSIPGKPWAWPKEYFIDFDDTITGIGAIQNGLLVFTKYKTYIVSGTSPENFSKYLLDGSQGCISHYTIQHINNGLVWMSTDGLCTISGGSVEVITRPKLGKFNPKYINNAIVLDNVYYLSYKNTNDDNYKILAVDFRYPDEGPIIYHINIPALWLCYANDWLYYSTIDNKIYEAFKGDPLQFTYKTGILTEGEYSNFKIYNNMYITYKGALQFKFYIDDKLVDTLTISSETITTYNYKFPSFAKGYGLQIEITGIGELYEINYNIYPRQKL